MAPPCRKSWTSPSSQNNEAVAKAFAAQDDIVIPGIVWELSGPEILVQDWLDGVPANRPSCRSSTTRWPGAAHRLFLQMVLRDGLFHADPHPGNVFALSGNRVGFLDFGLVGHLSPHRRDQFLMLLRAIVDNDADALLMTLLEWSGEAHSDLAPGNGGGSTMWHAARPKPLAVKRHHAADESGPRGRWPPSDLALLFKALVTADRAAATGPAV
ncbi:hypothetical protein J4714_13880 [Staphylococcus epidermidis]|nr:hypothetical protein [Staphylococcus epidermidis]